MPDYGMMMYGYARGDADAIKSIIEGVISAEVDVISASGQEDSTVIEILENENLKDFEAKDTRILMFLGDYTDEQFQASLQAMPADGSIPRPIFCTLTEKNINWKLTELLEDLKKEERYWKEKHGQNR